MITINAQAPMNGVDVVVPELEGISLLGYIDLLDMRDRTLPVVTDYKFTKSSRYVKGEKAAASHVQTLIYGRWAIDRALGAVCNVRYLWAVCPEHKTGRRFDHAKRVEVNLDVRDVSVGDPEWDRLVADLQTMAGHYNKIDGDHVLDVEPDVLGCSAYGGCPYKDLCTDLGEMSAFASAFAQEKKEQGVGLLEELKAKANGTTTTTTLLAMTPGMCPDCKIPLALSAMHKDCPSQQGGAAPLVAEAAANAARGAVEGVGAYVQAPINPPEGATPPAGNPLPPDPWKLGSNKETKALIAGIDDPRYLRTWADKDKRKRINGWLAAQLAELHKSGVTEAPTAEEIQAVEPTQIASVPDPMPIGTADAAAEEGETVTITPYVGTLVVLVGCLPTAKASGLPKLQDLPSLLVESGILDEIYKAAGVAWSLMEYGKGPHVLAQALGLWLDDNPGERTICVDARSAEGRACLSTLESRASLVIRGVS